MKIYLYVMRVIMIGNIKAPFAADQLRPFCSHSAHSLADPL